MTDAQLRQMAETAYAIHIWAFRICLKRPQALDELVKGFKVDLAEFKAGEK